MSAPIYQYKSLETKFKDIDTTQNRVSGYFSAFGIVDSYNEVAEKGSFTKSLNENRARIKYLLNHDVTKSLGPFEELREDDYGLFYVATVLPTSFGKDFLIMAEGGIIKEHSIGYKEVKSREEKGIKYIQEHKLFEGSALTGWGVNQYTPMVKTAEEAQTRVKQLEDFCRNTTASDETIQSLLIEIKQLNQVILSLQNTTVPEDSTQPESKGIDLSKIALIFSN